MIERSAHVGARRVVLRPAAFDAGGGGKAAQAERRIAEVKAAENAVAPKKKAPEVRRHDMRSLCRRSS